MNAQNGNRFVDLTGRKFGKLNVIKRVEGKSPKRVYWLCKCDCGNECSVVSYNLVHGKTKSCGCQRTISSHNVHFEDLSGKRYGKIVVLERAKNRGKHTMWKCICDCGSYTITGASELKSGTTKSCGCLRFECKNSTHGLRKTRLYRIWSKMKDRCLNENNPAYKWYGLKGITVCQEWIDDFMNFYNWSMANGYTDELTLDRIDSTKGYSPDNCRWTTMKVQQNNRNNNQHITYNGETRSITEWCDITGMKYGTLYNRIKSGYSPKECLEVPLCSRRGRKRN